MKRIASLIIAVCMLICMMPAISHASEVASGECGDNLTWTLDSNGTLTISGTGEMYDWPGDYEASWYNIEELECVIIKNGVTSIGDGAFADCFSLTNITIPGSVTSIGDDAFGYCESLTSITIPDGVTSIGDYAFENCSSLTSITISDSVVSIGDRAFSRCDSLTSIAVSEENKYYCFEDGVLFDKNKTQLVLYLFANERESYSIPDGVTSIGDNAFEYCYNLTSITIPDSVTSIGDYAFCVCDSLTSITIPESVTSIGDNAFTSCDSLTSITIPESVTSIGGGAFSCCDSLTSIAVSEENKYYCFEDGVLFDKNKTQLVQYLFANERESYSIPNGVTSIGDYAFECCYSLTNITIPDSVTSIGNYAFCGCDITDITIPNSVTSIGDYAFESCRSLTSITIPESVTSIGKRTFYQCDSLTDVYYAGSESDWQNVDIGYSNEDLTSATIHYNCKGAEGYINKLNYSEGILSAEISMLNSYEAAKAFLTISDSTGKLIGIKSADVSKGSKGFEMEISETLSENENYIVKLMLWNENAKPFMESDKREFVITE